MRALAQYIGVCSRSDVCAAIQLIALGTDPTTDGEMKGLKKAIQRMSATGTIGLILSPLDMKSVRLVLITDASFDNARDYRRQLGYVILMKDNTGESNIVHYASAICKRVTLPVLAAELHALVLGFHASFVIREMLQEITGRTINIEEFVDSKTIFDVVAKDGGLMENAFKWTYFH